MKILLILSMFLGSLLSANGIAIVNSLDGEVFAVKDGTEIKLKQGERHRLIGLDQYCLVAEIWQHTDKNNPSNEEDIVRVQDDFGR